MVFLGEILVGRRSKPKEETSEDTNAVKPLEEEVDMDKVDKIEAEGDENLEEVTITQLFILPKYNAEIIRRRALKFGLLWLG